MLSRSKLLRSTTLLSLLAVGGASAQTGTSKPVTTLNTEVQADLASGQPNKISAVELRSVVVDMLVSYPNLYSADGMGVDCTGATDSSTAFQAAINQIPDNSFFFIPQTCLIRLANTVNIVDRVGLTIGSFVNMKIATGAPGFVWGGANNGTMFDIEHSDHPTFQGASFNTDTTGGRTIGTYLNFDGCNQPTAGCSGTGTHTGTAAEVKNSNFIASGQNNSNFVAIAISRTVTTNHENYYIHDITVTCDGGQRSTNRSINATITSGSNAFTAAGAGLVNSAYPVGDVGARARFSYPGAQGGIYFDTTIASVTGSTTGTLASNFPTWSGGYIGAGSPLSGVQLTIGTNFGTGILQGPSQNAKHSKFYYSQITGCDKQIDVQGGSADVRHLGGGFGGIGVSFSGNLTDAIIIEQVENEGNLRDLDLKGGVAPFSITGQRIANANQLADGFLKLGSNVTLTGSASVSSTNGSGLGSLNNTHSILVGEQGGATTGATGTPVSLVSINNNFGVSRVLTGYDSPSGGPLYNYGYTSIYDNFGSTPYQVIFAGQSAYAGTSNLLQMFLFNLPTSSGVGCPVSGSGRIWANSGVLTVC